jgi:hypothetical protein
MRKWLIIHAFFLCFIGIAMYSHAGPSKVRCSYTVEKQVITQNHSHSVKNKKDQQDNQFYVQHRTRFSTTLSSLSVLRENSIVLWHCDTGQHKTAIDKTEEIVCDQLLHLFPSHYFW